MQQLNCYLQQGKDYLVCMLKKSLYGLKQSIRCWKKVLTEFLISAGFEQSSVDPCTYVQGDYSPIAAAAYVDDVIIAKRTEQETQQVKKLLQLPLNNDDRYGRVALLPRNHYHIHSWRVT